MDKFERALAALLGTVFRVLLWVFLAVLAVGLLALALVFLLVGALWALVRGRRPQAPVFAARFQRYAAEQVWPGRRPPAESTQDVVDVEVREVPDERISRDRQQP